MITAVILASIERQLNAIVIEALHAQMQGYNARLARKTDRNAQLVAAFTGKVTKCPPARRRR